MRARRLAAGLSLRQAAREAGVNGGFLSHIERGIAPAPIGLLLSVANLYPDVDPGEWLWLALRDRWGDPVAALMLAHAWGTREVVP